MHSVLGTWLATQVCALTENRTGDPLVRKLALDPLSQTSQGPCITLNSCLVLLSVSTPDPQLCAIEIPYGQGFSSQSSAWHIAGAQETNIVE